MRIPWILSTSRIKLALVLVMATVCLPLQAALAQSPIPDGLVPAGETIQGNLVLSAPEVKIEGIVDGDVFAFSQNVLVTGEIKGNLFVLGRVVTIDGSLDGDLYAANSRLTLGPTARVGHNVYAAAALFSTLPGSMVERDLYLIALGGELSGSIGRYQRAHLGILEILQLLFGEDGPLRVILPPEFQQSSFAANLQAAHPGEPALQRLPGISGQEMSMAGLVLALLPRINFAAVGPTELNAWLMERLHTFAPLLLIGLVLLWLFPRFLSGSAEHLRAHPVSSFAVGLVVFFVSSGTSMLAVALVMAVGLFFSNLNSWGLAWMSWVAGLSGMGVALTAFYLAAFYLSKIIMAYLVGILLLGWMSGAAWGRRFWVLLTGEVMVVLLLSIPTLGWVLSVLTTMFGLGTIYLYFRQRWPQSGTAGQTLSISAAENRNEPEALVETAILLNPAAAAETPADLEPPLQGENVLASKRRRS